MIEFHGTTKISAAFLKTCSTLWYFLGIGSVRRYRTVFHQLPQLSALASCIRAELDDGSLHRSYE